MDTEGRDVMRALEYDYMSECCFMLETWDSFLCQHVSEFKLADNENVYFCEVIYEVHRKCC
jgi:hypothetical protein